MVNIMLNKAKSTPLILSIVLFTVLSIWWAVLALTSQAEDFSRYIFGASYGVMALFGGIYGVVTSRKWGAYKSSLGRAILFLACGLLLAEFGQLVFSYYNIIKKELVPYPSLADIGFFGNMSFYVLGGFALAKVLGVSNQIKKNLRKLVVGIVLPVILLASTYKVFLVGYDPSGVSMLQKILDFGYPLGDAIYVSVALVALLCVARILGGSMRKPLMLLLFAFMVQYVADFNFLYQISHETWVNGGYGDFLYLFAYFVMTLSLIKIANVYSQKPSNEVVAVEGQNG